MYFILSKLYALIYILCTTSQVLNELQSYLMVSSCCMHLKFNGTCKHKRRLHILNGCYTASHGGGSSQTCGVVDYKIPKQVMPRTWDLHLESARANCAGKLSKVVSSALPSYSSMTVALEHLLKANKLTHIKYLTIYREVFGMQISVFLHS